MAGYDLSTNNGILGPVPGDELSDRKLQLPPAGEDQPEKITVEFESARLGPIRVTFRGMKNQRRAFQTWFWTPCHAELVQPGKVDE